MPFLTIDTSTYDSSEAIRRQLTEKLDELNYVINLTSKFLGIYQGPDKPKEHLALFLYSTRKVWSCLLTMLLFIGLLISVVKTPIAVTSIYLTGYIDFLFLFYYNWSRMEKRFFRSLMHSSTGVGILKRFSYLSRIRNVSIFLALLIVVVAFAMISSALFNITNQLFPTNHFTIRNDIIRIFYLACFSIILLSIPAANCICFSYLNQIMVEYEIFNNDFKTDDNTYQIAVTRHYAYAHFRIYKTFKIIQHSISYWISIHLIINIIIIIKSLIYLLNFQYEPTNIISNVLASGPISFYLVSCLFQSICFFYMSIDLRAEMIRLKQLMMSLLIGQRILHDQTYSLCIAFTTHLQFHKYGINFLHLTIIDRQFLNLILAGSLTYILLCLQKST